MTFFQKLRRLLPTGPAKPVQIVTDSTAELPPDVVQDLGITVVPLQVIFGEESFRDGVDLTSDEFFRRLADSSDLPTTSQPSVGEFKQFYEDLAGRTDRILSVHLSSGFSGTVDAARWAAAALDDRCQIEIIDSGVVSMAMGMAVIAAARAAREGADLEACAETARSVLRRLRIAVALDTLEYLRRGGRIGRAQAFLGGLLRLKPILTIRDGEAFPLTRVRTHRKALEALLRLSVEEVGDVAEAAVMHATTPEDARSLVEEIERRHPGIPVHLGRFGPVLGVHGGPGMIGMVAVAAEAAVAREGEPDQPQEQEEERP
jgi:DegV family protein with EDD domain